MGVAIDEGPALPLLELAVGTPTIGFRRFRVSGLGLWILGIFIRLDFGDIVGLWANGSGIAALV